MIKTLKWYCEEQLDSTFGARLTAHWIESGLLPTRPNRVTGATARYYIEMGVPDDYESYTEGDYKTLRQKVEMELAEDDIGAWEEMVKQKGFESQIFTGVTKPLEIPTVAYVVPASLESTATPEQVAASVVPVERTESMIMAGKIVKL